MKPTITLAAALAAGIAMGSLAATGLGARDPDPGAYAVIDVGRISDHDGVMRDLMPLAGPAIQSGGGRLLTVTERITSLDGTPAPPRFVVIAFADAATAVAWYASPAWQAADAMRRKYTQSRVSVADAEGSPK